MGKSKVYLRELNKIGIALSAERDTQKLLELIVEESIKITRSDAASLYILEKSDSGDMLRFKITRCFSRSFPFKEFVLPLNNKSISGYSGLTGKILKFNDVWKIPEEYGLKYNDFFDKQIKYKTVNMLVIPMKDYNGNVVGVLQLLNKKKDVEALLGEPDTIPEMIEPYNKREEEIISSLASQAAILLERTKLYNEIEELFNSFIETMVTTIESRDKTTSGHSRRLAGYSVKLAEVITDIDYGPYKDFKFSEDELKEIYYAGLLHDIGKIGVREYVLQKRNRLSDDKMEAIKYRMYYVKESLHKKQEKEGITEDEREVLENMDDYMEFVNKINKVGFVTDEDQAKTELIASKEFVDIDGNTRNLLDDFEKENLLIKRGNLTGVERDEISSHVIHSESILKNIKWGDKFKNVAEIAAAHHEKLDGTGYPKKLKSDEILFQSKILAVMDIFEALTAIDRPYKHPMSVEKAISIIKSEVDSGHLDKDVFEIFEKEKIYEMFSLKKD